MQIISHSQEETAKIGRRIAKNLKPADIICLSGQLGSGKTVLAKGIAGGLGIKKDSVISPSFVLIRQYHQGKFPFYHFDLYRLKYPADIFGLGYEEYLYGDGVTVIEWADKLGYLFPEECLKIEILIKGDSLRLFNFGAEGRYYKKLLEKIYEDIRH